ncbi:hypothetical protein HPB47_005854 [Ixodes persulcatus]|uniref:Uncharacterized protein n=1 Tax=Ixodes persulcatus TaxID=34615 RepID=A0AC60PCF7_IXOPE|nr:hypothetical protein HPB47_005854 [Ixodes persulcatus]
MSTRTKLIFDQCMMKMNAKSAKAARGAFGADKGGKYAALGRDGFQRAPRYFFGESFLGRQGDKTIVVAG